jgi:hypothetical protein
LQREDAEAAHPAMPDTIQRNTFGNGSFMNNVSRIPMTVEESGIADIVSRGVFEPREGWRKDEEEKI